MNYLPHQLNTSCRWEWYEQPPVLKTEFSKKQTSENNICLQIIHIYVVEFKIKMNFYICGQLVVDKKGCIMVAVNK